MRLSVLLVGLLNSEPADSVNHILASYILSHLQEMVHMGLGDLAEQCQVSKATVSRFCRALGYRDFYELKYDCYELEGYIPNQIVAPGDSDRAFLQAANQQAAQLLTHISQKDLDRLAQALLRYENIAFMGHMESGDVVLMLQHDFYCLTGRIVRAMFRPLEQQQFFQSLREPTLVVVFSAKGSFSQRLLGANRAPKLPAGSRKYALSADLQLSQVSGAGSTSHRHRDKKRFFRPQSQPDVAGTSADLALSAAVGGRFILKIILNAQKSCPLIKNRQLS